MCILGVVWILLLLGMFTGECRVNPRIEYLVTFLCIGWFAYWTLSTVRGYLKKDASPVPPVPPQPTKHKETKSKKTKEN